jgi:hypothetical protein
MISEEQYNEACKIIDQYHLERQQEAENDLDDDWDQYDEDDEELEREMEEYETALNCTCGAWQLIKGRAIHIADCFCGAE